ncbi:MAG: Trm112 family protein [Halioglobus sp.]|nr:Trm112 family protein [Halioglobus sp.]
MDKKLLSILCCPVTHCELAIARAELLKSVNTRVLDGSLKNRDGTVLTEPLKEALVTDDGKSLYPIRDGIPVLLEGEAVALDQLEGG